MDVVRKKLDKFLQRGIDDSGNSDGKRTLSESWSGAPRFRILNKGPPQGDSWVDGRLTKTQVTSRPEMIGPEVWSSMSKCAQKKAKQQRDIEKPKIQASRPTRKIHDSPPDDVEQINAIIQSAKKEAGDSSGTSKPCDTQVRIPTAKTPTKEVAVSKEGGTRSQALREGRHSLTEGEWQTKTFEFQRCMLHRGRNHSHEDHVAARGFHSWHQNSSGLTFVGACQQSDEQKLQWTKGGIR